MPCEPEMTTENQDPLDTNSSVRVLKPSFLFPMRNNTTIPNTNKSNLQQRANYLRNSYSDKHTETYSLDESLKKIDISMQNLIKEAQASLLHTSSPNVAEEHPFQKGSNQRQMNLDNTFKKLENCIHDFLAPDMNTTNVTHIHHHHHHHHYTPSNKDGKAKIPNKRKWYLPTLLTSLIFIVGYTSVQPPCRNRYGGTCLFLLFCNSMYRKQQVQYQFPVINLIDRFMIRIVFSKGIPALFGCVHRFNIVNLCANYLFF